ncbi:adhesion G protein-coupled receptor E4-like [Misgurnus anguillicaudatus]|uniref:adhesion G protein-coupled receptor E4-like n=1 Tax=Misgurnus anguillicaudatus TaxID=75329 RepID=UPI003CCF17FA
MYCDINDYELHYTLKHHHCVRNNCDCQGDMYDCDCYQSTNSTCLCTKSVNTTTTATSLISTTTNTTYLVNTTTTTPTSLISTTTNITSLVNTSTTPTSNVNTTTTPTSPISTTTNTKFLVNTSTNTTCHVNTTTTPTSLISTTTNTTYLVNTTTTTPTSLISTTTNITSLVNTSTTPTSHVNTTTTPTSPISTTTNTTYLDNTTTNTTCHVNTTTTPTSPVTTTITSSPTTASLNLTLLKNCTGTECITNLLDLIENTTELPLKTVTDLLDVVFNASVNMNTSLDDPKKLVQAGNQVLKASEKLVSMLVKETNTSERVSLIRETVAAQVFMVGPQVTLNKTSNLTLDQIPQLNTTSASIDIDLIGNALNNNGSAAVAFMSYSTMGDLLKPDFFNKSNNTVNTMMSTVISATLPKTTNTTLTKPVNFTLKHIRELNDTGNLFCVYWNISEWIVDGCSLVNTNSSDTVCSCLHLSTFALIMQTSSSPPEEDNPLMEILNLVFVIVGLVFTSLALLTFAFCRWKPGVNNVARINLCISLLSAHLLFLLTQQFINLIKPHKELCAVISGALHFFFLSCFVWMFIEAVLLFICVKNLSQISSKQRAVLNSGFLIVIGYAIAFVIVGVSVGLVPEGYGSEKCWIKPEQGFIWSFLGPVCFILAINTILFISIISILNSTLKNLNAEVSLTKQTKIIVFKTLAQSVILGCPWILGFFVNYSEMIEIIFLILNSQQGTFIFLIYCFLNDEVRQQYMEWIRAVFP